MKRSMVCDIDPSSIGAYKIKLVAVVTTFVPTYELSN